MDLSRLDSDALYRHFSIPRGGLGATEAQQRLEQNGPNLLETATTIHPWRIFIDQFKSFIIYILLVAVVVSLLIGEYVDTLIILVILLGNAIIGFVQELGAQRSLEALQRISTQQATVLRGGQKRRIAASEVVPGDLLLIEAGEKVAADARLVSAVQLKVEESLLTGESLPVEKSTKLSPEGAPLGEQRHLVFSATTVATGNGTGIVIATGMATELGKIAALLRQTSSEPTPLQRRLDRFGRQLGVGIIAICIIVFLLCFARAYAAGDLSLEAVIAFAFVAISLAVAAVPTALPAVVTIALSIGVKRLLAKKALVRNLASVETLGSCDVICSDKTGTITAGAMTVRHLWSAFGETVFSGSGYTPQGEMQGEAPPYLLFCLLACNNASLYEEEGLWRISGDPTEAALLVAAAKAGVTDRFERRFERPFDSRRKRMSVAGTLDGEPLLFCKGAPDQIFLRCSNILTPQGEVPLDERWRDAITAQNSAYAAGAERVLALALRRLTPEASEPEEVGLTFLGLVAMSDPPRPEVAAALRTAKEAGIQVLMITGDYGATASAIAREVGIEGESLSGAAVETMESADLRQRLLQGVTIFSRVAPEHKLRIVEALQHLGHTVAMTGDGVNDAPALKQANIGVAVGSGTEVAKEAADFVLLDDSFAHIVAAVEEGRGIYDNIQKSIMLLLSGNLGEVLIIFLAVLFGLNLPLTAILLLWINMVTDGAPAIAYSVDPYGHTIMRRLPKPRNEGILPVVKLRLLLFLGIVGTALALLLFAATGGATGEGEALLRARTLVFNFVVLYEVVLIFVIRSGYGVPFLANRWVWGAALLSLLLQGLLMYTPLAPLFGIVSLPLGDLSLLAGATLLFAAIAELYQRLFGR